MDWMCGSSCRPFDLLVPALQVQSPEFKPQSPPKDKKEEKGNKAKQKNTEASEYRSKRTWLMQMEKQVSLLRKNYLCIIFTVFSVILS
jgi:hypothetical protein